MEAVRWLGVELSVAVGSVVWIWWHETKSSEPLSHPMSLVGQLPNLPGLCLLHPASHKTGVG